MIHNNPTVETKITQEMIDRRRMELTKMQLSDDELRRQKALIDQQEKTLTHDPNVMVIIELIDEQTKKGLTKPLVWSRNYDETEVKFGFWGQPRKRTLFGKTYELAAWQEVVPADMALPKVESMPKAWKLVFDPRRMPPEGAPVSPDTEPQDESPQDGNSEEPTDASENSELDDALLDTQDDSEPDPALLDTPEEPDLPDEFSDALIEDKDYEEFLELEKDVVSQGGPTIGQIKKSADPEKVERYNELREMYHPE